MAAGGACRPIKINGMEKHFGRAGFLAINKRGEHLHSPLHTSSVGDRGYGDVKVVKVGGLQQLQVVSGVFLAVESVVSVLYGGSVRRC